MSDPRSPAATSAVPQVLMIDDEAELAASTVEYLRLSGVTADFVTTAEDALVHVAKGAPAVLLLDVNLPGMSGFELCRRLRASTQAPILFISARSSDDDQVLALTVGGDDYIVKPFSLAVLLAKVRRLLSRSDGPAPYDDGRLRIDPEAGRAYLDASELALTAIEYRILLYLVSHRGRVVPKHELIAAVWGDEFTTDGTLTQHIRRLRTRVEPDPNTPTYLRTVWGRGYLFEEPPR